MSSMTVFRACPRDRVLADVRDDEVVEVTVERPVDGWEVLYELHPDESRLEATDREGVFRVRWREALEWPHQVTAL